MKLHIARSARLWCSRAYRTAAVFGGGAMYPRIERFTEFQHPAIVNGEIAFPFPIPGHVANQGMNVEIGIIGSAGFMLE